MKLVRGWLQVSVMLFVFLFTFMTAEGFSQIIRTRPIDILNGLADGTIQATINPALSIGPIERAFDGNPFTEAAVQDGDTLRITLRFETSVQVSKSKVFFWNYGDWTLEAANTIDDLNNGTGSYSLLANNKAYEYLKWDSVTADLDGVKFLRLTARNPEDHIVYLGEWIVEESITLTSFFILPHPPRVLPGTSLQLSVKMLDDENNVYDYDLNEPVIWSSSNTAVATVSGSGRLTGVALGTSMITASTELSTLSGSATASVESDFQSTKAIIRPLKVALVFQNPVTSNGQKLHQRFGWINPYTLVDNLIEEFSDISDGVVIFQIVETDDDTTLFTRMDGEFLSVDQLVSYYSTANWQPLRDAAAQGRLEFDYNAMLEYYDLCTKRNNGEINEVWVYAHPFAAMYESRLTGPNAFWYNSPPLTDTDCTELLSIMGWNYERGIPEALESFGHRVESTMRQAYGRWDVNAQDPNNWELFTRIDKDHPGSAHVGTVHFPPNGLTDYDWVNTRYVTTYADNWKRYPYLLDQTRTVNCEEWGCSYLGWMRWWFSHLPRYGGVTEGILNNWWHYVVDYERAVELAGTAPIVKIVHDDPDPIARAFSLEQNYPNPFNPVTTIEFSLPRRVSVRLKIYSVLGEEVVTLMDEELPAGRYTVDWRADGFSSGVYFYRLQADAADAGQVEEFIKTRKLILLK